MNLYIIYGSESLLVKPYLDSLASNFICLRIYNNKIPKEKNNFYNLKCDDQLTSNLEKIIKENLNQIKKIYFIGAASIIEKNLFLSSDYDHFERMISTNINNYIKITKAILPFMIRVKHGSIIYLSSFRAIKPTKGTLIYSSSKSFCETFFKGIGIEYGRFKITSHIIRMGAFDGKMLHGLGSEYIKNINKQISLGREGTADELCNTIKFLQENPYTNTGVLEINGGLNIDL